MATDVNSTYIRTSYSCGRCDGCGTELGTAFCVASCYIIMALCNNFLHWAIATNTSLLRYFIATNIIWLQLPPHDFITTITSFQASTIPLLHRREGLAQPSILSLLKLRDQLVQDPGLLLLLCSGSWTAPPQNTFILPWTSEQWSRRNTATTRLEIAFRAL